MNDKGQKIVRVTHTIRTQVVLEQKQYDEILRSAVGAPPDADVAIEDSYGGDITVTWTEVREGAE